VRGGFAGLRGIRDPGDGAGKVIYVDTENNFSLDRLQQIAPDYQKILSNIVLIKPTSFEEQKEGFEKLKKGLNDKTGLIVVDTIAMLYRLKLGKAENVYEVNRELGRQLSDLGEIAAKKKIPVIMTNQIYADLNKGEGVKIVGGDLLKYASKCLIELQALSSGNRRFILRKHRSIPSDKEFLFKIVEGGILGTKEKKFKLF